MLLPLQPSSSSNPPRAFLTLKILSLLLTCRAAEIRRFQCAKSCWCRSSHKKRSKSNKERVQPTVVTGISQLNPTFQASSVKAARPIRAATLNTLLKGISRQRGDLTLGHCGIKVGKGLLPSTDHILYFASMTNQSHSSSVAHTHFKTG